MGQKGSKKMKEEIKSHGKTWLFFFTIGICLMLAYKIIDGIGNLTSVIGNLVSIVSPFFAGLLMAYLLYIPENKIESVRIAGAAPGPAANLFFFLAFFGKIRYH